MFKAYIKAVVKARWAVIFTLVAITAYLAPGIRQLRFDSSSDGSVPRGDPSQEYFDYIKDDFGNDQVAMLVITSEAELGVFEPATLQKITRLTDSIGSLDGVDNVVSLTNSTFLSGMGGEELTNDLIVPGIPPDRDSARSLRDNVLANELFHRTLVSADGHAAAINIFLDNESDSVLLANGIDRHISQIAVGEAGPENLYYAGLIHTRMEINKTMHGDLGKFIPASFGLILLVLLLSFRSVRGVILPALTIVIAVTWTFGLVGRMGVPINMTMTIIPPLLIAIASSLAIHMLATYNDCAEGSDQPQAVIMQTFRFLAAPLLMAGITTAIGFGSLIISPIPNIQKVGLFSVAGILFAIIVGFSFVPAVLACLPLPKRRAGEPGNKPDFMSKLLAHIINFNLNHRVAILVISGVILALSLSGLARVQVDTDFISYFKKHSEVRRAADVIGEKLAGVSTFYVIATADDAEVMRRREVLEGVDSLQKYMESLPDIDRATSMVNIIKLFNQAMNGDDPAHFRVPLDQDVLDEAILLTIDQEEPAVRAHYVVEDYSSMAIFARSQLVSTSQLAKTIEAVEEFAARILPPEVSVAATGTVVVFAKSIDSIIQGQRDSLLLAFALILIIMSFLFRSIKVGLISMISNTIPIFVIFGIMGWFRMPLNIGTSVVASISLGIAVDDTIHYMMHYRQELGRGLDQRQAMVASLQQVGKPVINTSLALAFGFAVICFSDFGMLTSVGLLTAITMITCLISDLFLTSALLLTFDFGKKLSA